MNSKQFLQPLQLKTIPAITFVTIFIFSIIACKKNYQTDQIENSTNPNLHIVRLNGQDVQVLKKGDLYYFYDDVYFDQNTFDSLKKLKESTKTKPRGAYNTNYVNRWPNGIIYYNILSTFTQTETSLIQSALNHWATNTSLSFVQRTNQPNYIGFEKITSGPLGSSNSIGMKGGYQRIELFTTHPQYNIRTIIHEIGHALGLYHEQSRADRDNHLIINWGNIGSDANSQWQFKTYIVQGRPGADHNTFDWNSIMLYGSYSGSINGNPTMLRRSDNSVFTASGQTLSSGDIATIINMYGQPPFIKLRNEIGQSYNTGGFYEYRSYNTYIDFYVDRLGTIPFIPTENSVVNLEFYGIDCDEYGCGSFGNKTEQKTLIPNGTNSFFITSETWESQEKIEHEHWVQYIIDTYSVNVTNFYQIF